MSAPRHRSVDLLGPDVILLAMETLAAGRAASGNAALVVELARSVDAARVATALGRFLDVCPWLGGRLRRDRFRGASSPGASPPPASTPRRSRRRRSRPAGSRPRSTASSRAGSIPAASPAPRDARRRRRDQHRAHLGAPADGPARRRALASGSSPSSTSIPTAFRRGRRRLLVAPPDLRSLRERGALAAAAPRISGRWRRYCRARSRAHRPAARPARARGRATGASVSSSVRRRRIGCGAACRGGSRSSRRR